MACVLFLPLYQKPESFFKSPRATAFLDATSSQLIRFLSCDLKTSPVMNEMGSERHCNTDRFDERYGKVTKDDPSYPPGINQSRIKCDGRTD